MRIFFIILFLSAIASSVWVIRLSYSQDISISLVNQLVEELVEEENRSSKEIEPTEKDWTAPLAEAACIANPFSFSLWRKDYLSLTPYLEINSPPPEV